MRNSMQSTSNVLDGLEEGNKVVPLQGKWHGSSHNNNNNNSLFTFTFLYNITMFSIFRKREEKLDSYKDTKI